MVSILGTQKPLFLCSFIAMVQHVVLRGFTAEHVLSSRRCAYELLLIIRLLSILISLIDLQGVIAGNSSSLSGERLLCQLRLQVQS